MHKISFSFQEQKLIKGMGVEALLLFGSQAQGTSRVGSDYDIAVILKQLANAARVYDVLYDLLAKKINQLVDIDIVFLHDAPMELQSHVAKYGIVLFQTTPPVFADYKGRVMLTLADFAPLRKEFQNATLGRIAP